MKTRLAVLASIAMGVGAVPAGAATYCVSDPACPQGGITAATPQAALQQANASDDVDVVRVGPGVFAGPLNVLPGTTLAGAGRGATTIIGPSSGALLNTAPNSFSRDFGLRLSDGARTGIAGDGGITDRVDIDGTELTVAGTGVVTSIRGTTVRDSRIVLALGTGADGGGLTLEDSTIDAPTGYASGDYSATMRRVLIKAGTGMSIEGGSVTGDAVAVIASGTSPVALQVPNTRQISQAAVTLTHGTLVGPAGRGTGAWAGGACTGQAAITLTDSAIGGFATQIARTGGNGSGQCIRPANVTLTRTAYDPARVVQSGAGTLTTNAVVPAASLGLGPDYVPQPGSPLLDAGNPVETSGLDLRRLPRPFGAAPDLGAYEYQGAQPAPSPTPTPTPTPTVTPSPTPTASPTPEPVVRIRPDRVTLTARRVGRRKYRVRATVVADGGDCTGGRARFTSRKGALLTSFDADCHADVTVRAEPGTRIRVRFGGTATLEPLASRKVRLRK